MKQKGFAPLIILLVAVPLLVVVGGAFYIMSSNSGQQSNIVSSLGEVFESKNTHEQIPWEFDGEKWLKSSNPPNCPEPLKLSPPADMHLVTALLYPGQIRSGNYKSHGGFAFQNSNNEEITVKAPMDGYLVKASRYIEVGELQYFLVFINPCGIMYKLDHLVDLSPNIQNALNSLPEAKVDDSRTTDINSPLFVKAGEPVATSVGFSGVKGYKNVTFDLGIIDLRNKNQSAQDPNWLSQRKLDGDLEYAPYGICLFDLFDSETTKSLKSLPAYDLQSGKTSDYCKN